MVTFEMLGLSLPQSAKHNILCDPNHGTLHWLENENKYKCLKQTIAFSCLTGQGGQYACIYLQTKTRQMCA